MSLLLEFTDLLDEISNNFYCTRVVLSITAVWRSVLILPRSSIF
jgi:hypothetical protein